MRLPKSAVVLRKFTGKNDFKLTCGGPPSDGVRLNSVGEGRDQGRMVENLGKV